MVTKMRKSLGEKRKQIDQAQIDEIVRLYGDFTENDRVKILPNEAFGFLRITVERPLKATWRPAGFLTLLGARETELWMRDRELEIDEALSKLPGDLPTEKQAIAAIKKVLPDLSAKNAKNLRTDEPTSEPQYLIRTSYADFSL